MRKLVSVLAVALLLPGAWSAQVAPAEAASVATIDTSNKAAVANAYNNVYLPTLSVPLGWTGSVSGCNAGAPTAAGKDAIMTAFNYFRAMAGLWSVTENAAESAATQQAALMMQANNTLSHSRPSSWSCYTEAGSRTYPSGGGGEIIATIGNAQAIPLYMLDPGSGNQAMGHRASILTAQATQIGVGSTSGYNAIHWIYSSSTPTVPADYSWPSKGYFPYELISPTATRWSFYPKIGSAVGASVSVTKNGTPLSIPQSYAATSATNMFSGNTALGWDMPTFTAPAAGATDTYHVTISGITGGGSSTASYDVLVFSAVPAPTVTIGSVSITGTAAVGNPLTASVASVSPADATKTYQWYRNDEAISGATNSTYTITALDVGKSITVRVTASKSGYVPASKTSTGVTVQTGTITVSFLVARNGSTPGSKLTVETKTMSPSNTSLTFRWFRDGQVIGGETNASYILSKTDMCRSISVEVTASSPGYTSRIQTISELPSSFSDVPTSHTFFNAICWAAQTGVTAGSGPTTYAPSNAVNRGSMAQFLYRLAGSPPWTAPATSPFVDVPKSHQFYSAITWLYGQGITTGVTSGGKLYYQPDNAVNRGSMSAFLYRLAGKPSWSAPSKSPFADLAKSHQFYSTITWLADTKITAGSVVGGKLVFQAANPVNRGSMSAFMQRLSKTQLQCGTYANAIGC